MLNWTRWHDGTCLWSMCQHACHVTCLATPVDRSSAIIYRINISPRKQKCVENNKSETSTQTKMCWKMAKRREKAKLDYGKPKNKSSSGFLNSKHFGCVRCINRQEQRETRVGTTSSIAGFPPLLFPLPLFCSVAPLLAAIVPAPAAASTSFPPFWFLSTSVRAALATARE
jgi:hypothetical protein